MTPEVMTVTTTSIFLTHALDYFSVVWVELILGALAGMTYFLFSSEWVRNRLKQAPIYVGEPSTGSWMHVLAKGRSSSPQTKSTESQASGSHPNSPNISFGQTAAGTGSGDKDTNKKMFMRANDIRSCARNGNLLGAKRVFDRLGDAADNTLVLNSMLNACVECKELQKAIVYFNRAKRLQLADSVTYNKMIKGYLAEGQEVAARQLLAELTTKGMANCASYHALLNACVNTGNQRAAWKLIAEMQGNGVAPNAVTCAILLKGKLQTKDEVSRGWPSLTPWRRQWMRCSSWQLLTPVSALVAWICFPSR